MKLLLKNHLFILIVPGTIGAFLPLTLTRSTPAVAALVSHFVTRHEEPHLLREFGQQYEEYRVNTPRWFPRSPRAPDA